MILSTSFTAEERRAFRATWESSVRNAGIRSAIVLELARGVSSICSRSEGRKTRVRWQRVDGVADHMLLAGPKAMPKWDCSL